MNTLDILKAARAKIEKPENWTKRCIARNAAGDEVDAANDEACCWCAGGACRAAVGEDWPPTNTYLSWKALSDQTPDESWIAAYNDDPNTTHADILALFDRAIAAEEAKAVKS